MHVIFGSSSNLICPESFFANIFIHSKNYHHVHSPTFGRIVHVEHIPGQLLLLRPWAYPTRPSLPALTNERVVLTIVDDHCRWWIMSVVGGPLVGSIELAAQTKANARIERGEKLASFRLGSTCCVIAPIPPTATVGSEVFVGDPL